jgi:AraC-like DNA-binding protein
VSGSGTRSQSLFALTRTQPGRTVQRLLRPQPSAEDSRAPASLLGSLVTDALSNTFVDGYVMATLVRDRMLQTQLAAAVRAGVRPLTARIVWCDSPEELYSAVADRGATIAITEWADATDLALAGAVQRVREEFPTVAVLVYAPLTPAGAKALLAAGRAGVCEVILAGHDDVGRALGAVLARAALASVAERAVERLSSLVPADVMPILAYALRHARSALDVGDIARSLHVHRKTLADRCRRAGAPPPRELAAWGRLVLAAERLSDRGRSAERVAAEFGYASGSAFANMLKRYTGLALAEIRVQGPAVVLESLVRRFSPSGVPGCGRLNAKASSVRAAKGPR